MQRSAPRPTAVEAHHGRLSERMVVAHRKTISSASLPGCHVGPIRRADAEDAEPLPRASRDALRSNSCPCRCSPDRPTDVRHQETARQHPRAATAPPRGPGYRQCALWRVARGRHYRPRCGVCAIDALGPIVATDAADPSRAYGLAVDNAGARLGVASDAGAELLAKSGVHVFPRAIQAPQPEIVIGRMPGWKLVWQQPPGTATPNNIEDCVEDLAHGMQSGSAKGLRRRQERLQARELSVRQVSQVGSPQGQTPAILPAKPTSVPVFRQSLVCHPGWDFGHRLAEGMANRLV